MFFSTNRTDAVSSMLYLHRRGRVAALDRFPPASGSLCTIGDHTLTRGRKVTSHMDNRNMGESHMCLHETPPTHGANMKITAFRGAGVV